MSHGIKETKEVLVAAFAIAELLAKHLKDGVQLADALAIVNAALGDVAFQDKIMAAVQGAGEIPAEMSDIGIFEGLELGKFVLSKVQELGDMLKK